MFTKTAARSAGGPIFNPPSTDFQLIEAVLNVPSGFFVQKGQVFYEDMTQLDVTPFNFAVPPNITIPYSATIEVAVPSFSQNAGRILGVYQGPSFTTGSGPLTQVINLLDYGYGVVLGSAVGANLLMNSNLIAIPWTGPLTTCGTGYGVKPAAFSAGNQVGTVKAFFMNTAIPAAITSTGSQAVSVSPGSLAASTLSSLQGNTGIYGIVAPAGGPNSTLVIDSTSSGVQETVTISAVTPGVAASETLTVGGALVAGATITTTMAIQGGSVAVTYTQLTGDTVTTAAVGMCNLINASAAVSGPNAFLQPVTNIAGAITFVALATGTIYNTVAVTGGAAGGGFTYTAGSTLAGGTNSTFTAAFSNLHGVNAPVQGSVKNIGTGAPASTQTVLAASGFLAQTLIPASIKVI